MRITRYDVSAIINRPNSSCAYSRPYSGAYCALASRCCFFSARARSEIVCLRRMLSMSLPKRPPAACLRMVRDAPSCGMRHRAGCVTNAHTPHACCAVAPFAAIATSHPLFSHTSRRPVRKRAYPSTSHPIQARPSTSHHIRPPPYPTSARPVRKRKRSAQRANPTVSHHIPPYQPHQPHQPHQPYQISHISRGAPHPMGSCAMAPHMTACAQNGETRLS